MKKRLFSWLLVLAMVLSMMPTVAFAEEVKPNQLLQKEELFTVDAATTYDPTAEGAILVPADDTSWTSGGVSGSVPGAWADIHASDYLRVFMYTATDADLETVSAKLKTSFTLSGSYTFYFEIQPRTNDVEVALPGVKVGGKTLKLKFEPNGIAKLYNAAYSKDLEIGGAGTSWTYVTITVDADAPSVTVKVIRTNTVEETITASDELTLTTANAPATFELVQAAAGTSQVRLDKIRYWCDHAAKSKTAIGEAVEATCTTAGQTAGVKCADCESVWEAVETITATGHSYDEGVVTDPTCTEGGYTTYTCVNGCGDSYTADETEAAGHAWDEGAVTTEPTETTEGIKTYTCVTCGDTKTENLGTLAHSHSYTTVVTAPTCEAAGYTTYTCTCGYSYTADETEALGHTEVTIPGVAPTYVTTGLTEGTKCSVCGEILVAQEEIPVLEVVIPNSVRLVNETFETTGTYDPAAGTTTLVPAEDGSWTGGGSATVPGTWADVPSGKYLRVFAYKAAEDDVANAKLKTNFTLAGSYTFYFELQARTNNAEVALPGVKVGGKTLKLKFDADETSSFATLYNSTFSKKLEIGGVGTAWAYVTITVDADTPSVTVKVQRTNTVEETITADDGLTLTKAGAPATVELFRDGAGTSQVRLDKIRFDCNHAELSQTAIGEAVAPTHTTTGMTAGIKCSVCDTVIAEQTVIPVNTGDDYTIGEYTEFKAENSYPTKDGCVFAGWYTDSDYTTPYTGEDDAITTVYAKFVDAATLQTKVQLSADTTAESETTKLRLVSTVDSLNYAKAGFTVNGNDIDISKVFGKIKAAAGGVEFTYTPTGAFSDDSYAFTTVTLTGFNQTNFGTEFTVTAWWVTLDGIRVEGETRTESILTIIEKVAAN